MTIFMLDAFLTSVLRCLVEKEKGGGHLQKEYTDTYKRIVETATM